MANFLEQLVVEWLEFQGYFVRRNVKVGRRPLGGYECELDVVAYHPIEKRLVHYEPSTDSHSWDTREKRFSQKFKAGQKYIPRIFDGLEDLPNLEQIALLAYASTKDRAAIGGGSLITVKDFMLDIRSKLKDRDPSKAAVSEQFQILRALQFAAHHWR